MTLEERIREQAYHVWQYHRSSDTYVVYECGRLRERTALDDWLEAEFYVKQELEIEKENKSRSV